MSSVMPVPKPGPKTPRPATGLVLAARIPPSDFRFTSLVLTEPSSLIRARSSTLALSFFIHAVLITLAIMIPLLWYDVLPAPGEAVRAFFVPPPDLAPPPPPPPPPPAGVRPVTRTPVAPRPVEEAKFVAPIEMPTEIQPEESLDLGVEGGVPGGVEGGVPGGVVGGIVGGLPAEVAQPTKVVRVGGNIVAPKLVRRVDPVYPALAAQARLSAIVILEALVDTRGHVKSVSVLRGAPLFDDPAIEAVKQWRYQPLLLNGKPTEFILTVTLVFKLQSAVPGA
jgi:protein TonB